MSGLAQGLNKVVKVAPIEVARRPTRTRSARRGIIETAGVIDVGNVAIWLPVTELTPLTNWFDDFVIAGHNDATRSAPGRWRSSTRVCTTSLFRIDFAGLGIFRITHERLESRAEVIALAKIEMYCESVHLATPATPPAPPPSTPRDTGARRWTRLVGVLADALRPPSARPIPTAEALASRLLASVETGPIDLVRDDFTSGVVSGAAEIYRAVAPSLGERRAPA